MACKETPQSLCEHMIKLSEERWGDNDKLRPGAHDDAVKECVADKTKMQRRDGKQFDCFASCVSEKRRVDDLDLCNMSCGIPLPPDDPSVSPSGSVIP